MATALHWWEGQFYCEFLDNYDGGLLRMFADGELVCEQPAGSAALAFRRARELKQSLPPSLDRRKSAAEPPPIAKAHAERRKPQSFTPPR